MNPPPTAAPERGLVMLCGPAASGKSTWAAAWAPAGSVVSSDAIRGWLSDDPADQSGTPLAFQILHLVVKERLRRDRLVVADTTALRAVHRQQLLAHARLYRRPAFAVLFAAPLEVLRARNRARERTVPDEVLVQQVQQFEAVCRQVASEGFDGIWELSAE